MASLDAATNTSTHLNFLAGGGEGTRAAAGHAGFEGYFEHLESQMSRNTETLSAVYIADEVKR